MRTLSHEQVVAEAAEWYDANYPGWHTKVDLGALDLGDADTCIAGQILPGGWHALADGYIAATSAVRLACAASSKTEDVQFADDASVTFASLHDAWRDEIKRRFDEGRF